MRPCFRLIQPKPPPSVRPATPVVELMPSGCREREGLRLLVEVRERAAGLDPGGASDRVDAHRAQRRQVDQEPAVADGVAGDVVAAAAHRDQQFVLAREVNRADDVGGPGAADDHARPAIDHGVPDRPCRVVAGVTRQVEGAAQAATQRLHLLGADRGRPALERGKSNIRHVRSSLAARPSATPSSALGAPRRPLGAL